MRFAALLALTCTACAVDNAGYILPTGSLAGTTAIVSIVSQEQMAALASGGVKLKRGETVNGLKMNAQATGQPCLIYLIDTPRGLAALEHELWHCRGWTHD